MKVRAAEAGSCAKPETACCAALGTRLRGWKLECAVAGWLYCDKTIFRLLEASGRTSPR